MTQASAVSTLPCQPSRMTDEEPRRIKSVEERIIRVAPTDVDGRSSGGGALSQRLADVRRDQFQVAVAGHYRWGRGAKYSHRVTWTSKARRKTGEPKRIDTACGLTFYEGTLLTSTHYDCPRCP